MIQCLFVLKPGTPVWRRSTWVQSQVTWVGILILSFSSSCDLGGKFLSLSGLVDHDSETRMITASILSRVSSSQVGVIIAKNAGQ